MWALGVSVYSMFVGYTPFFSQKRQRTIERIQTCDFEYNTHDWSCYSREARNFIDRLIEPNIERRLSAAEALKHPWIQKFVQQPNEMEALRKSTAQDIIQLLDNAQGLSKF